VLFHWYQVILTCVKCNHYFIISNVEVLNRGSVFCPPLEKGGSHPHKWWWEWIPNERTRIKGILAPQQSKLFQSLLSQLFLTWCRLYKFLLIKRTYVLQFLWVGMRELKSAVFFNNKLDRGAHMNFTINWSLSVHLDTICLVGGPKIHPLYLFSTMRPIQGTFKSEAPNRMYSIWVWTYRVMTHNCDGVY